MAKPATPSPERAALAQAHTDLAARQEALAQAEAAHQQAQRAYNNATDFEELDARISALKNIRTHSMWQLRAERDEGLLAAYAAREHTERQAYPLKLEAEQAHARVDEAKRPIWHAENTVTQAAIAVACAEAEPVARAALARVLAAIEVILRDGPDLVAMGHRDLLPADLAHAVRAAGGDMLLKCRDWPEFERRFHASPWRVSVDLLKQDPQIPLPVAAP
jgi:hypothetical protein